MKTQEIAMTWLAAGVLAAGLNASYHSGGFRWAHEIADRFQQGSATVLAVATEGADQLVSQGRLLTARNETRSCRFATALARVQTRMAHSDTQFARFEALSARQEARMAQVEAKRACIEQKLAKLRTVSTFVNVKAPVICPRVHVNVPTVHIPEIHVPEIHVNEIHVNTSGSGPV